MTDYDAVVFDKDGVLVEPAAYDLLLGAVRSAFEAFGIDPPDEHVEAMLGADLTVERLESVCAGYGIDPAAFWERREACASAAQREAIRRGEKALYDDLDVLGALAPDVGVVSNNQHRTVEYVLDAAGLDGHVRTFYGREPTLDGIRRRKPNPYYLRRALADLDAETALYVGDSNADVEAAARAGVDSAFVRREHRLDYDLARAPTYEVGGLGDLPALLDGDAERYRFPRRR